MARFRFRLQNVLEAREMIEKRKIEELSAARTRHRKHLERLQGLQDTLRACRRERLRDQQGQVDIETMRRMDRYEQHLRQMITRAAGRESRLRKQVEDKVDEVQGARMDRKVLENLREKKKVEFIKEERAREQKEMDQIAAHRHVYHDSLVRK